MRGGARDRAAVPLGMMDVLDFAAAPAAVVLVLGATWLGTAMGRRVRRAHAPDPGHLGTIQGGTLGLLGLLLAFSFSGAMSHFLDRQHGLTREANAMGTAALRADLLASPARGRLRAEIATYARLRLELFEDARGGQALEISRRMRAAQSAMWSAAVEGVEARPQMASVVLPPVNEVMDLLGEREELNRRRLPRAVLTLVIACACVSLWTVGYGAGLSERGSIGTVLPLAMLVSVALFVTIDLDFPRRGFIQIDGGALREAAAEIGQGVESGAK